MTDAELVHSIAQFAAIDPDTRAGFDAVSALTKMLAGEPESEGLPRRVSSARGWHNFSAEFAAQRMLIIARSARGSEAAVAWLRKILAVKQASFGAVKALHGVKCSSDIPISANIVLTPLDAFPQSETLDWLILQYEETSERRRAFDEIKSPPSAALCYTGTLRPLFDDPASPMKGWFDKLDEAAQLLALVPTAIPTEAAHWLHADDSDVAMMVNFGVSRSFP